MDYTITHRTLYAYSSPVAVAHHLAHLRPRETARQKVLEFALEITPPPAVTAGRTDYFGNHATFLTIDSPHRRFVATARSRVRVQTPPPANLDEIRGGERAAGEYSFASPYVPLSPAFAAYARPFFPAETAEVAGVQDFIRRIYEDFTFDPRATTVATPVDEVFEKRRGVCQDFAHLGIACLRSLGLPARYVSGYLETLPPPGRARLIGADVSHAWFAVWCPGLGWVDADPTNDVLPGDRHMTLAWGRDFSDVSPLRGVVVGGGEHRLAVSVDVARAEIF